MTDKEELPCAVSAKVKLVDTRNSSARFGSYEQACQSILDRTPLVSFFGMKRLGAGGGPINEANPSLTQSRIAVVAQSWLGLQVAARHRNLPAELADWRLDL